MTNLLRPLKLSTRIVKQLEEKAWDWDQLLEQSLFKAEKKRQEELQDEWSSSSLLIGVDEVGRGPLAGPVVVGCVAFKTMPCLPGIRDSKKISDYGREVLSVQIDKQADFWSVRFIPPDHIKSGNLSRLILQSMSDQVCDCLKALSPKKSIVYVDGKADLKRYGISQSRAMIQGDDRCITIGAASVIAKTLRDRYMKTLDTLEPCYGWARNKGYGTKEHRQAIATHGVTAFHRRSFRGVSEYV